jgi:predicted DNA-binding transcriptional regulator AlpA
MRVTVYAMPVLKEMTRDNTRSTYTSVEVAEMFGLSRMTLDRWVKEEKIPRPMKDPRSKQMVWTQADLDQLARYMKDKETSK